MAAAKAWARFGHKHSPTKAIGVSPIRPTAAHLVRPDDEFQEDIFRAHSWTLLNTEEFYYQNTGSFVHHNFKPATKLCQILNDHRHIIRWNNRLINYKFLGKGSFGEVYQAMDKLTQNVYAIKIIKPPDNKGFLVLTKFLNALFNERNSFAELNQSVFFVRMLATFQNPEKTNVTFVLDYCICNLTHLISLYPHSRNYSQIIKDYLIGNSLENVSQLMSNILSMDYKKLIFLYLFEMACGLHYLASRHLVHADIKLENVLISVNGHLKFSDFGVSFKTDWFYRNSATVMPKNESQLSLLANIDNTVMNRGTLVYFDPEQSIALISKSQPESMVNLDKVLEKSKHYKRIRDFHQNFLSDLYAVGIVTAALLTGGIILSEERFFQSNFSSSFWKIEMIYREDLNARVIRNPFLKTPKAFELQSVLEFVTSIFQPREVRSYLYRKSLTKFHQKELVTEFYLDINSVQNMAYYRSQSITKDNVSNIVLPRNYIKTLLKSFSPKNVVKDINLKTGQKAFNLHSIEYIYSTFK